MSRKVLSAYGNVLSRSTLQHKGHVGEYFVCLGLFSSCFVCCQKVAFFIPISGMKLFSWMLPGASVPSKSYAIAIGISFLDIVVHRMPIERTRCAGVAAGPVTED